MIKQLKKRMRYVTFFPILLLSKGLRARCLDLMSRISDRLLRNPNLFILSILIFSAAFLIYVRSISVYTFDTDGQPEFLGILPCLFSDDIVIYFPEYLYRKSPSGRYYFRWNGPFFPNSEKRNVWLKIGGRGSGLHRLNNEKVMHYSEGDDWHADSFAVR